MYTEIILFYTDGTVDSYSLDNAHLGALKIWEILEDKYLPEYYLPNINPPHKSKRVYFASAMDEVWNLAYSNYVDIVDRVILMSTFDTSFIRFKEIPILIEYFEKFSHIDETNLKDQIDILKKCLNNKKIKYIKIDQASNGLSEWINYKYDKINETYLPYDPEKDNKHFFMFKDK